jgi:undecaprenyl-diphosphatase
VAALDRLLELDALLRLWLAQHHAPWLDQPMLLASWIGRGGMVWLVCGAFLTLRHPSCAAGVWRMALAVWLALAVTDAVVKPAVRRGRPFVAVMDVRVIGERPNTYSFPSGHAASAFAGAVGLSRAWPAVRAAAWGVAAAIAVSRVYVGVHYPIDVAAGAALGMASAWFVLGGRIPPRSRAVDSC